MIERVREVAWSTAYEGRLAAIRTKVDHLADLFEAYRKGTLAAAPKYTDAKVGEVTVISFHAGAPHGEEHTFEGSPGPLKSESSRRPLRRK